MTDSIDDAMKDALADRYGVGRETVDRLVNGMTKSESGRMFVECAVIKANDGSVYTIKGSSKKSVLDAVMKALSSLYWNDSNDDIHLPTMIYRSKTVK